MVFDITSEDSFKDIEQWLRRIDQNADQDMVKVLIANKIDKSGQ